MHVTVPVHEATLTVSCLFFPEDECEGQSARCAVNALGLKDVGVFICQTYFKKKTGTRACRRRSVCQYFGDSEDSPAAKAQ